MTNWQAAAEAAETALREAHEERNQALELERRRREELVEVRELLRRLISEMRAEITSKSTPIVHEAATLHWLQKLEQLSHAVLS